MKNFSVPQRNAESRPRTAPVGGAAPPESSGPAESGTPAGRRPGAGGHFFEFGQPLRQDAQRGLFLTGFGSSRGGGACHFGWKGTDGT